MYISIRAYHGCKGFQVSKSNNSFTKSSYADQSKKRNSTTVTTSTDKPPHYWDDVINQKRFMESATKLLNIKDMNEWYSVTKQVKLYTQKITKYRIFPTLGVAAYSINITTLLLSYFLPYILNMSGYHGNLNKPQSTIGTM
jgi:hypothetical protein